MPSTTKRFHSTFSPVGHFDEADHLGKFTKPLQVNDDAAYLQQQQQSTSFKPDQPLQIKYK